MSPAPAGADTTNAAALHPDFAPVADVLAAITLDIGDLAAARTAFAKMIAEAGWTVPEGLTVEDRAIAGVRVRVYRPQALPPGAAAPLLLFLHGGSFALGDLDTENGKCAELALRTPCVVVSVDYRLSPEHPYPAGLDDAAAVLSGLAAADGAVLGVDAARIAVGGSSAGGGLAVALALRARDAGGPALCAQILLCPPLDDALSTPSMRTFTDTPIYDRGAAEHMWRYYLGADRVPGTAPAGAAPARADDLRGLPRTFLAVAGLDPLRDEGLAFAARLQAADVAVDLVHVAGAPHGFDAFDGIPVSDLTRALAVRSLAAGFAA